MSIEQLTDDERASFLIGLALRRVMTTPSLVPPEIVAQAWAGYSAACDHGMTPDEAVKILQITSLIDLSDQWLDASENDKRPRKWKGKTP